MAPWHLLRHIGATSGFVASYRTGVLWNTVATVVFQGTIFVTNLIVANLLGQEGFGQFSILYTTLVVASGMAQIATGVTAAKYVAEFRDVDKRRAGRILGLCLIVSVIGGCIGTILLWIGSPYLAEDVLGAPDISGVLAFGSGYILFSAVAGYQQGALTGLQAFRALTWISIGHGVVHVVGVAFATAKWGLLGTAIALTASAIVRWLLFQIVLRREAWYWHISVLFRDAFMERQLLRWFAAPSAIAGLISLPAIWIATASLVQQPAGYAQLGLFAAANNIKNFMMFLPAINNTVGLAVLNNQRGHGDERRYRKVFWLNLVISGVLLLGAGAILAIFGKSLLQLYGPNFGDGYFVLLVLLVAGGMEGMTIATYQVVQSQERMWQSLFSIVLPRDAVLVISAHILVARYAGIGLALAFVTSAAVSLVATILVTRSAGMRIPVRSEV